MVDKIPSDEKGPKIPDNYKGQFKVSPQFRKFWEKMFTGVTLEDKQIAKMTEQFINQVWNQMNYVLKKALEKQKELDKKSQGKD